MKGVLKVAAHGRAIARWLHEEFGSGASSKSVPLWLLGAPENLRAAFVRGYGWTDGSTSGMQDWEHLKASTTSRALAHGLRSLGVTLGFAVQLRKSAVPAEKVIEGRIVRQQPFFTVIFGRSERSSVEMDGIRWQLVRQMVDTGERKQVFNLEVADDNSYLADGIIVHNCQAFSIAGARRSLDDARGNLSLAFVMLLDAIDDFRAMLGLSPAACLWENVPGVLSVKDNAFGCFLAGLVGAQQPLLPNARGRWGNAGMVVGPRRKAAWRVLDAQHFGLAQRRRRVFVVASAREGFDPTAVLLELEGVQRHSPPGREARQKVAASLETSSGDWSRNEVGEHLIAFGGNNTSGPINVSTALNAHGGPHGPHGRLDFETETFCVTGQITHALKAEGADASEDGTGRGNPIIPVLAFAENSRAEVRFEGGDGSIVGTLGGGGGKPGQSYPAAQIGSAVRRLTPLECERLQGLPDGFTMIPWKGKPADECPDGPRYKAIGNGWAIPCVQWVAERLVAEVVRTEPQS